MRYSDAFFMKMYSDLMRNHTVLFIPFRYVVFYVKITFSGELSWSEAYCFVHARCYFYSPTDLTDFSCAIEVKLGFVSMFGSSGRLAVSLIFAFVSVFVLCEYVIYYLVILRCSWPHIDTEDSHSPLRALFLSDTHLLGAIRGHWLDKLRR